MLTFWQKLQAEAAQQATAAQEQAATEPAEPAEQEAAEPAEQEAAEPAEPAEQAPRCSGTTTKRRRKRAASKRKASKDKGKGCVPVRPAHYEATLAQLRIDDTWVWEPVRVRAKTIGAVSRRVAYRVGWKATKGRNVHDFSADISMDTWATAEYLAPWFVNVAQSAKQDGAKDVKDLITIAGI